MRESHALSLRDLGWIKCSAAETHSLKSLGFQTGIWRAVLMMNNYLHISDFLDALAVFIRKERRQGDRGSSDDARMDHLKPDSAWVLSFPVCIHPSIQCWKKAPGSLLCDDASIKELLWCTPVWQGKHNKWRRNCVWVQKFDLLKLTSDGLLITRSIDGWIPGEMQVAVTVVNWHWQNESGHLKCYTDVFVDLFQLRNHRRHDAMHGMIEVQQMIKDLIHQH